MPAIFHSKNNNSGLMLIELVIVIFLIILILGLSSVFFANSLPRAKFNSTVREFASNIKYARTFAKIKGQDQTFFVDFDLRQYGINGVSSKDIPDGISIKAQCPFYGEIYRGRYQIIMLASGGVQGGTLILTDGKRTSAIYLDPVVGSIVVK